MDNHPIPQDVTGFQFKLIGNMTVKQFGYLATGIVLAWILFQLPINILIKFPFCLFSAILGAGLAYFPVSGRPMDVMIGNYIKTLFRPTQFLYEKTGGQIYFPGKTHALVVKNIKQYKNDLSIFPKDKLKTYLESLNAKPKNKADETENNFSMTAPSLATSNISHQPDTAPDLSIQQINPVPIVMTQPPSPLAKSETKIVKPILDQFNKTIGMPNTPESPNLITGITRDARGNALSNILVEVKDKDGSPIRAFKTNEFGRFASATPLTNGTYAVEFEDPKAQNKFEQMTVNVAGQIILPIVAISVDTREELRRSLFAPSGPVPRGAQKN